MNPFLSNNKPFHRRHIGPSDAEIADMLSFIGYGSLDALIDATIPGSIRLRESVDLPEAVSENDLLEQVAAIGSGNRRYRSFIGMGYYDTVTPPAIQRNIFENPAWYTQYTPYQAEISQGRLEALLNYQTAVIDLTGLEIANASLLDEATAAAEAMMMFRRLSKRTGDRFLVSTACHPQTIAVVQMRAEPIGVTVVVADHHEYDFADGQTFGALLQYPATDGRIEDLESFCERAHAADALVAVATDLLALTLLKPPGEFGADVALGNSQRFGVPMGYGGPHAAFFATRDAFKRQVPGRIIGVSVDVDGNPALRMALQTREQHIRRDKATSNICTAQVLLAIMAGAYAVYHGPHGLLSIANRTHALTRILAAGLERLGHRVRHQDYFDTLRVDLNGRTTSEIEKASRTNRINVRMFGDGSVGISLDEPTTRHDVDTLLAVFGADNGLSVATIETDEVGTYAGDMARTTSYLEHQVFHRYHSETEMMRYLTRLASRDLSLTTSMIPLGSCTMKLNAAAELMPVSSPAFSRVHPFAPPEQAEGYRVILEQLASWLGEISGLHAVSLQPNSGASGEYAGLLVIRAYHQSRGDANRDVCLIPESAHGTNPASAVMAGMRVVPVACDNAGNVDLDDLRAKAEANAATLAALMVTYPSTHGVFEAAIEQICEIVHENGGQVYLDGANMNAQVGLCRPGDYGADVCHLNLHKTFSIPHGGGGPGMGPICAADHLAPFLPGHPIIKTGGAQAIGPVAAAPFGSASILLISWAYIYMMGGEGLRRASEVAVLNAYYVAAKLGKHFNILYRGAGGTVAHEFILDLRPFKQSAGITEVDVAKRLMDYGYHAPTMSWPVAGTMMIEPTESEGKVELDRFCDAMIAIRSEIRELEEGLGDRDRNPLTNAPHTAQMIVSDAWDEPYSREQACFPAPWTREHKFWPPVRRVNDAYGDRNLVCACPPMEAYV